MIWLFWRKCPIDLVQHVAPDTNIKMNILFLCTGNSCRSQMAEGWARHFGGDLFQVQSAGIEMHGKNPRAFDVMREAGVDISRQESTRLTDQMLAAADYVVTVCGHADENCPALPADVRKEHWPLDDPAKVVGAERDVMAAFRDSRDDIRIRVEDLIHRLSDESGQEPND
jgi:arsenate reductase